MRKSKHAAALLTLDNLKYRTSVRVREFSQLTGIPAPSVYALVNKGEIKATRRGNSILIPKAEIPGLG